MNYLAVTGTSPGAGSPAFGEGTHSGRRGASPKGARRVECRGAAIPHPKVRPGPLWDGGEGHAVPIDWMQALWPLVLRASAMASSPAETTTHSNSMACCQPRRAYGWRDCGR